MEAQISKGKEIVANKGNYRAIYRLIGHDLYLFGVPNNQYNQMITNFKQKHALKSSEVKHDWVKITLIDEISDADMDILFNKMMDALKMMGFTCVMRDI